jgi:hypothetical protein
LNILISFVLRHWNFVISNLPLLLLNHSESAGAPTPGFVRQRPDYSESFDSFAPAHFDLSVSPSMLGTP